MTKAQAYYLLEARRIEMAGTTRQFSNGDSAGIWWAPWLPGHTNVFRACLRRGWVHAFPNNGPYQTSALGRQELLEFLRVNVATSLTRMDIDRGRARDAWTNLLTAKRASELMSAGGGA